MSEADNIIMKPEKLDISANFPTEQDHLTIIKEEMFSGQNGINCQL